jgi:hypothetical protein
MTPIAIFAPVESPALVVPVEFGLETEDVEVEEEVVVVNEVEEEVREEVEEEVVAAAERSLDSYTILTPYAFNPSGYENGTALVLVTPFAELSVAIKVVPILGATHVQNNVLHMSDRRLGVGTQERVTPMSESTGQHVTVVMEETPVVSWQAVE